MAKKNNETSRKTGPKPEALNIEGDVDWTDAMKHAMSKPKPKDPKKCEHKHLSQEVMCGQKTGDYICQDCGEMFTPPDLKALHAKQKEAKDGDRKDT